MEEKERRGKLSKAVCKETKAWLKRTGMKQKKFASDLGIDYMTVWCWLRYGHAPNWEHSKIVRRRMPECPLLKELRG